MKIIKFTGCRALHFSGDIAEKMSIMSESLLGKVSF